jgi:hypothetical protein
LFPRETEDQLQLTRRCLKEENQSDQILLILPKVKHQR